MNDKRHHPRINECAEVTVNIKAAPGFQDLENKTNSCYTTDVSLRGVQLHIDTNIQVGTLLELVIEFEHLTEKFMHLGSVVWIHESNDEGGEQEKWYNIGIRFDVTSNPQYKSWVLTVTELLGSTELT